MPGVQDWQAMVAIAGTIVGTVWIMARRYGGIEAEIKQLKEALGDHPNCKEEIADIRARVDIIWGHHVHRLMTSSVQRGIADMNSPISIPQHSRDLMTPLQATLTRRYETEWKDLSDMDLLLAIEKDYGGWISQNVDLPNGFHGGEGLIIAAAVAGRDTIVGPHSSQPDEELPPG